TQRADGRRRSPRLRPALHFHRRNDTVAEQLPHKYWAPEVKASKLKQTVPFHNLRAAHASWLLAGGVDIIVVQERLGHRQIQTTQQYTGTLPDAGDRALEAFRKIRFRQAPPEAPPR